MNRSLIDVTLCLKKRKPFDFLVEPPFLKKSRDNWQNFEVEVQPYVAGTHWGTRKYLEMDRPYDLERDRLEAEKSELSVVV